MYEVVGPPSAGDEIDSSFPGASLGSQAYEARQIGPKHVKQGRSAEGKGSVRPSGPGWTPLATEAAQCGAHVARLRQRPPLCCELRPADVAKLDMRAPCKFDQQCWAKSPEVRLSDHACDAEGGKLSQGLHIEGLAASRSFWLADYEARSLCS